jgi:hypothetical protein
LTWTSQEWDDWFPTWLATRWSFNIAIEIDHKFYHQWAMASTG